MLNRGEIVINSFKSLACPTTTGSEQNFKVKYVFTSMQSLVMSSSLSLRRMDHHKTDSAIHDSTKRKQNFIWTAEGAR